MTQLDQVSNILEILASPWTWVAVGIMLLAAYWAWDSRTKEIRDLLKEIRWNTRYMAAHENEPAQGMTTPSKEN